ncbi:unannotated protein [freshwater metagenome]|uniref:Unannotated protein n=1 Tax=freshwater metagenome TaxID=449393 RepID=A0A6J7PET8_9ZZZZ
MARQGKAGMGKDDRVRGGAGAKRVDLSKQSQFFWNVYRSSSVESLDG